MICYTQNKKTTTQFANTCRRNSNEKWKLMYKTSEEQMSSALKSQVCNNAFWCSTEPETNPNKEGGGS